MIRLTLPHWYAFPDGVRLAPSGPLTAEEWGRLREGDAAFGFGSSREKWIASGRSNSTMVERAEAVTQLLKDWRAPQLVSVGVGTGIFEFLLKSAAPNLTIRCGDWAAESLELLQQRFTECDSVERMDLRRPTWIRDSNEIVLLNRVDMELSDTDWSQFFKDLAVRRVRRMVWIPCGLLTASSILQELRGVLVGLGRRRHLSQSGYMRTPARMMELFSDHYERREVISRGDLPTWGLHLTEKGLSG